MLPTQKKKMNLFETPENAKELWIQEAMSIENCVDLESLICVYLIIHLVIYVALAIACSSWFKCAVSCFCIYIYI